MKERIVLWAIRRLLLIIPHYDVAYRENIAYEGRRVYKARKMRRDAGIKYPGPIDQ